MVQCCLKELNTELQFVELMGECIRIAMKNSITLSAVEAIFGVF
jgi:hypothetical protein